MTLCWRAMGKDNEMMYMQVLASGPYFQCRHYSVPYVPPIPGLEVFPGPCLHSHSYRDPGDYAGRSVLVIGAGPSGRDVALDIASYAEMVYLSCHANSITSMLPSNMQLIARAEKVGSDGKVIFADGKECFVDSIIICTGYKYELPFLEPESGVCVVDRRVSGLYKHTFSALHPSLALIGINVRVVPFPYFELQVKWVLAVWSGARHLPSTADMLKDAEDVLQELLARGVPLHRAHFLGQAQWTFYHELATLSGTEPLNPVLEHLYAHSAAVMARDLQGYKEREYAIVSVEDWEEVERG